jgi:hypothetical protein
MASCIVLLSTAIARYVEGAFIEMSQIILRISDEELPRYRKTLQRWGNPSSKNVSGLFARLGLFDLFTDEAGLSNASAHAAFLDEVNQKRNAAAHGLPNLETLIPEWTEGAVARSLREHTKMFENDLNKALCNHLIKREIAI